MKIVVLGAKGRLGQALCGVLPAEVVVLGRDAADLTKGPELRKTLTELAPNVIVNAAGYTDVDGAESEPKIASAVNGLALRDIATVCKELDCTLIHFSTNYVFGGDTARATPYTEADKHGPINRYGRTKLDGEMFTRGHCGKHFILRTCGLFGGVGPRADFVTTMLAQAAQGRSIRVVNDQTCTPTSVLDLARAVLPLLDSNKFGLYHITNSGSCTWHEFAQAIFALKGVQAKLEPVTTAEYAAKALRPRYSVLDNTKWQEAGFAPLRPWRDALADVLK